MNSDDERKTSSRSNGKKKHQNGEKKSSKKDAELKNSVVDSDDSEEVSGDSIDNSNSLSTNDGSLSNSTMSNLKKNKKGGNKNKTISDVKKIREEEEDNNKIVHQETEVALGNRPQQKGSQIDLEHISNLSRAGVNIVVSAILIFILISATTAVFRDFEVKRKNMRSEESAKIEKCQDDFQAFCGQPETLGSFMRSECSKYQECFMKDPNTTGINTKMAAEILAEALNAFVEPLSFTSIAFLFGLLATMIMFCGCMGRGDSKKFEKNMQRRMEEMDRRLERIESMLQRALEAQR